MSGFLDGIRCGDCDCNVDWGEKKQEALKSCLLCLESYCTTHLERHQTRPGLQRHPLKEPVANLEARMSLNHNNLQELFCQAFQMIVSKVCTDSKESVLTEFLDQEVMLGDQMKKKLRLKLEKQMKNLLDLQNAQTYKKRLRLDPASVHSDLKLDEDETDVSRFVSKKQRESSTPQLNSFVFAKESFKGENFYYEVQVKGDTGWTLGVVRKAIENNEITLPKPLWVLRKKNDNPFITPDDESIPLLYCPKKVGVFVDYHQGLVSFYDADTADLIYSFTGCDFSERLYPSFSPGPYSGKKTTHLIITD